MSDLLFKMIDSMLEDVNDGWTSKEQAHELANTIIQTKPAVSVEIGVYAGKGVITMALAHQAVGFGHVVGIDPWNQAESAKGQDEDHGKWWSHLDHERIYQRCMEMIDKYSVKDQVRIIRETSSAATPPEEIGLIRIDGNHSEQAFEDVKRYCPNVISGGTLHLDDARWARGAIESGADKWLEDNGWEQTGEIDGGLIFRKTK